MPKTRRTVAHHVASVWEDLSLLGGSTWQAQCNCGYVTRHCATSGTAYGLVRRHMVLFGRGRPADKA